MNINPFRPRISERRGRPRFPNASVQSFGVHVNPPHRDSGYVHPKPYESTHVSRRSRILSRSDFILHSRIYSAQGRIYPKCRRGISSGGWRGTWGGFLNAALSSDLHSDIKIPVGAFQSKIDKFLIICD